LKNPKNEEKRHPNSTAKSRIWGTETPKLIDTKSFMPGAVQEIITHANFGEDRLRGFCVARGRILVFFHCLASSPLKHSRTTVQVCVTHKVSVMITK